MPFFGCVYRIRVVTFCGLAVLMLAEPERCVVAELPAEFYSAVKEFRAAVNSYSARVTTYSESSDEIGVRHTRYTYSRMGNESLWLDEKNEQELASVGNTDYSFTVERAKGEAKWTLNSLEWNGPETLHRHSPKNIKLDNAYSPAFAGIILSYRDLYEAVTEGYVRIESISSLLEDESAVSVSLSRTEKEPTKQWRFRRGTLVLHPDRHWQIASGEIEEANLAHGYTAITQWTNDFNDSEVLGVSLVSKRTQISNWSNLPHDLRMSTIHEYEYYPQHISAEDFRLSAFGIPEPKHPRSLRMPFRVITIGALVALLVLLWWWSRRTAYSDPTKTT